MAGCITGKLYARKTLIIIDRPAVLIIILLTDPVPVPVICVLNDRITPGTGSFLSVFVVIRLSGNVFRIVVSEVDLGEEVIFIFLIVMGIIECDPRHAAVIIFDFRSTEAQFLLNRSPVLRIAVFFTDHPALIAIFPYKDRRAVCSGRGTAVSPHIPPLYFIAVGIVSAVDPRDPAFNENEPVIRIVITLFYHMLSIVIGVLCAVISVLPGHRLIFFAEIADGRYVSGAVIGVGSSDRLPAARSGLFSGDIIIGLPGHSAVFIISIAYCGTSGSFDIDRPVLQVIIRGPCLISLFIIVIADDGISFFTDLVGSVRSLVPLLKETAVGIKEIHNPAGFLCFFLRDQIFRKTRILSRSETPGSQGPGDRRSRQFRGVLFHFSSLSVFVCSSRPGCVLFRQTGYVFCRHRTKTGAVLCRCFRCL